VRDFIESYRDEIKREIADFKPKHYPFYIHGDSVRTLQGGYLTHCTTHLQGLILGRAWSAEYRTAGSR
jgi:hypothetical protein